MAKGKLILICQSGGEFVTNEDGTMSYSDGEANAANVTSETPFNDLKLTLAETCNLDQKTVTIKYFLPGNKRNLITVKNDKDVKRMIDFHGDAITAEVFVTGEAGFDRIALDMHANRQSGSKKDESINNDSAHAKKDKSVKKGKTRTKKDDKVPTSPPNAPPAKRTRRSIAAAKAQASSDESAEGPDDTLVSENSKLEGSSSSSASSDHGKVHGESDAGSDYLPSSKSKNRKKRNSESEIDVNASPADTVKKRRRTPSWKFGANGRPTIVSVRDDDSIGSTSRGKSVKAIVEHPGGKKSGRKRGRPAKVDSSNSKETKSGKKRGRKRGNMRGPDDCDQERGIVPKEEHCFVPSPLAICDDDVSPETLVASWKSAITGVGQEFTNVHEFRDALQKYAIANRFVYKFKKNDTSRAIGGCAAEGCSWKFYAVWVPITQSFKIKTLNDVHTCDKESRKSAHPTKNWLVSTIKERLQNSPHLKPKEIANELLRDFGVELKYTQVWRGIGDAREQLHGSLKEAYNKLPWFCEKIVETNPGSIAKLVVGDKKRFKSLFISFYASVRGFQNSCRPLLFLEATSFKSKYGEVLLTANAIDGNDGFFPVAFAIIDVEDDNNWRWFLEQLKAAILNSHPITFVFDKEKNLKKSVLEVFGDAFIGYSIYHLLESFKRNVKGPFHGDGKAFLPVHFLAAAYAVRLVGFRKATEQIKQISSQAYDWVMQIDAEHWTSSSFKGERYNYITEDVSESYAKLMEDYRELPILQKIDALIRMMIDAIGDAKLDATMWSTYLTASKEKELEEENLKARGLKVLISSDTLFEVREDSTHVVNISNWSCTCLGWKETGLPCRHALAVFALIGKSPYDFCSNYFTVAAYRLTYAETINLVPIDGPSMQIDGPPSEKDEGEKREGEKEKGVEEEGDKGNYEIDDGNKEDSEMEEVIKKVGEMIEVEKEEGSNEYVEKEEGGKLDVEKEEGGKLDAEKEEGGKLDAEKEAEEEKGGKIETENAGGEKIETENTRGEKVETENAGGEKIEIENARGEKEETENARGEKEGRENGGDEKEEMEKGGGEKEEEEDGNVMVLPPIPPPKGVEKKEKMEWVETEGEMKRTVTCTKCKQPGHNKKSCRSDLLLLL